MTAWIQPAADDPFGLHNLPLCATRDGWVGVRAGDLVLNLAAAEEAGLVDAGGAFTGAANLNRFLAAGRPTWKRVRAQLTDLFTGLPASVGRTTIEQHLHPVDGLALALPFEVADYVDFYSSEQHANNLSAIFRPDSPSLLPNWKSLPIGYHGRAGTVVVSGTDIPRPDGQRKAPDEDRPTYGPSRRLDVEAELGFVVGVPSKGAIAVDDFREHVFGAVLVNDWSARDIQAWEYQPLGPFLGKSFATSVSPWVVPLDALEPAKVAAVVQDPPVLHYLEESERYSYDIRCEIRWNGTLVSQPPYAGIYWTPAQQLAHLTANGAWARTGDLYASGTISGDMPEQTGSFIERTWNGTHPVRLDDGTTRSFLLDGDTVTISATGWCGGGAVVGFGEVTGTVVTRV
ncbi:fumarylacetoacetase [Dactylosporangium sp. NPDC000521]|uniref:fumarylacetoacetase n=1 Tax=Dactylosporangium sp. NPDC000521 TaxID=3363975 RepID=UPI0036A1B1D8